MKISVIGSGFVSEHLSYDKINTRLHLDVKRIENLLDIEKPDVLINCIGKTGRPNIDWCETHKEETAISNITIPIMLAEACAKKSIHLIQIGSGCIYFGESSNKNIIGSDLGWKEDDFANPKSYYSKTKYACDLAIGQMKHVTTLRIRMPISTQNNSRNFINKIRGYKQIIDIPNSATFMNDLVNCIDWIAKNNHAGIFHVVNPQPLSAAKVMKEYQKYDTSHQFEIITEEQLDKLTLAKRSNCILNGEKLMTAGFYMTPTSEALSDCMDKYIKNL